MSFANRLTGKNLFVGWIDSGGGTVMLALHGDYTAFTPDIEMEMVDMSAGADAMRGYKATLKNFNGMLERYYLGTAGTAADTRLQPGDEGTLLWGELGTAAGKPKWGIPTIVSKVSMPIKFDDKVLITTEFKPQGDFVFDGTTATW